MFGRATQTAPRRRSRSFGWIALAAAVLGLASVPVVPIIYVIGMISVIGIPLALAVLPFPTICMAIVIAYLIWRIALFRMAAGVPLAFVGALAVLVAVPLAHNFMVTRDVRTLRAGDIAGPVAPLGRDETLVIVSGGGRTDHCDETCLDLLLSGRVKAVGKGRLRRGQSAPAPDAEILVHHLSRAPSCGERRIYLPNEAWKKTQPGTVAKALADAEARGMCINSIETTADKLVAPRFVAFAGADNLEFSKRALFIATLIEPSRVIVHERTPGGELVPVFQQTRVSHSLLGPLLAYDVYRTSVESTKPKWWRLDRREKRPEMRDELAGVLGLQFRYKTD